MSTSSPFTLDDLARILREGAGDAGEITADREFELLGYDSLALLETYTRIEREYGITLDEDALGTVRTPGQLIEVVTAHLTAVSAN
ncbi:acyl carrier protein [Streptomyces sp. NPDC057376]|uniref:acyl carrier protein n=1 Tax=unclassified Streptomyces TaxID=2593676 RepID=UPI00093FA573|nr:acyl carrier protein [Streptomyces sp. CB02414]OKI81341.1 actinorhodin polyketide synthase [Streptomyces sp. CB02414]